MNTTSDKKLSEELLDQASDWYARLKSDHLSDQDRIAFSKWLSSNAAHQQAYAKIEALWEDLAVVSELNFNIERKPQARKPKNSSVTANPAEAVQAIRSKPNWLLLASPALIVITLSLWITIFANNFQTSKGEQRTIFLEDGSIVYLNTNSSLSVNINKDQRLLKLKYGEAFFDVAHDNKRPFIVEVGGVSVQAVGTAFDIYHQCNDSKDTIVTVVDGKVRIQKDPASNPSASKGQLLKAFEQARISDAKINQTKVVNASLYTSWKDQQLIYDGTPLIDVIKDINRYTEDELKISDESLKTIQVSAVFKIQDQQTIIKTLEKTFNLKAIRVSDSVILLDKVKT